MVKEIAEHSIDMSLVNQWSKVLDLGSREFGFAKGMLQYVDKVCCVDADADIITPDSGRLPFLNVAVGVNSYTFEKFIKHGNGTGNFVFAGESLPQEHSIQDVEVWSLETISRFFDVDHWDVIKMDVEGSEYDVIMSLTKAPAKQLSFELHQHTSKRRSDEFISKLFKHLEQWYSFSVLRHEQRHGAGYNYWDVLMVEK